MRVSPGDGDGQDLSASLPGDLGQGMPVSTNPDTIDPEATLGLVVIEESDRVQAALWIAGQRPHELASALASTEDDRGTGPGALPGAVHAGGSNHHADSEHRRESDQAGDDGNRTRYGLGREQDVRQDEGAHGEHRDASEVGDFLVGSAQVGHAIRTHQDAEEDMQKGRARSKRHSAPGEHTTESEVVAQPRAEEGGSHPHGAVDGSPHPSHCS